MAILQLINKWKVNKEQLMIWTLVSVAYAILILFYWAPFSWNSMPYHDKWNLTIQNSVRIHFEYLITVFGDFFLARTHAQDIYTLGNLLSRNSFIGYNIVLAAVLYFKSLFTFALTKKITKENVLVAFLAGVFVSIWPTDGLWFELDFTSYHLGSLFLIIAIFLFIKYYQDNRLYLLILAIYSLIWSLSIIEHAILTAIIAPIIIILLDKKITKRLILTSLVWWVPPLMKLASFGISLLNKSPTRNYELNMIDRSDPFSISMIWSTIKFCYKKSFYSWVIQLRENLFPQLSKFSTFEVITYSILAGILVIIVIAVIQYCKATRNKVDQESTGSMSIQFKRHGLIFFYCFISIYVAFFLFVPTTYRFSTIRTFIYPSLWIGISMSLIIWFLSQLFVYKKFFFAIMSGIVTVGVVMGSLNARSAMHDFTNYSFGDTIPIYENISEIKANTVIVIIDHTPADMGFSNRQKESLTLNRMVRFAYNDNSLFTVVCRQDSSYCKFEKERLLVDVLPKGLINEKVIPIEIVEEEGKQLQAFPYDRLMIFQYENYDNFELQNTIPSDFSSSDVIGIQPEAYNPLGNIEDHTGGNATVLQQRLKSFFGYALDYLVKRNIFSKQRVMSLLGE